MAYPEQVVGSSSKTAFEMRDGKPTVMRLPEINFIDDKAGKPVGIHQHIGQMTDRGVWQFRWRPSDAAMDLRCLRCALRLPDPSYRRRSGMGLRPEILHRPFDKALDEAETAGWTVVDMKTDWAKVFAFGP